MRCRRRDAHAFKHNYVVLCETFVTVMGNLEVYLHISVNCSHDPGSSAIENSNFILSMCLPLHGDAALENALRRDNSSLNTQEPVRTPKARRSIYIPPLPRRILAGMLRVSNVFVSHVEYIILYICKRVLIYSAH